MPTSPAARTRTNAWRMAAGSLVLGAVLVVGCDATQDSVIPRPGSTLGGPAGPEAGEAPSGAPSAAPATVAPASAPLGDGTCPKGLWSTIKDGIDDPAVALVGMVDGCREARIETTLDRESVAVGLAICRKAAEIAFQQGVTSITVLAADATRLAGGATDAGCTGRP